MRKPTQTVEAQDLVAGPTGVGGDFLAGLDNGYVVDIVEDTYAVSITFHTAEGDEATLTCPKDMPVLIIERRTW